MFWLYIKQSFFYIWKDGAVSSLRYPINEHKTWSALTETIINLETVNPIEFFGVNNGKLDLLKKKFPLLKSNFC